MCTLQKPTRFIPVVGGPGAIKGVKDAERVQTFIYRHPGDCELFVFLLERAPFLKRRSERCLVDQPGLAKQTVDVRKIPKNILAKWLRGPVAAQGQRDSRWQASDLPDVATL